MDCMTILILDIGNTRMKAAVMRDGEVLEQGVLSGTENGELRTENGEPLSESVELVRRWCGDYGVERAIASVVGKQPDFGRLLPAGLCENLHILSHRSKLPITLDYDTPQTLGMDRVAAVIGARTFCPEGALVVVDAGSCITIDLLDGQNRYCGGAIMPGIRMRFRAMNEFTASLPLVDLSEGELGGTVPTPLTGKSTRSSMVSGVCNAALYEIEGFMRDYEKKYPGVKLFLTGGDAVFFAERLFFPNFANRDLMYIGLGKILELNLVNMN